MIDRDRYTREVAAAAAPVLLHSMSVYTVITAALGAAFFLLRLNIPGETGNYNYRIL